MWSPPPAPRLRPQDAVAELRAFEAALGSRELRNALITPAVPAGRKRAVVGRVADILELSRITRNFLFVLIDHRRIAALRDIVHDFELVLDERLGFARAEVASARELSEATARGAERGAGDGSPASASARGSRWMPR